MQIRNLLRKYTEDSKLNILTIPSDPVFDHYWSQSKDNVSLFVGPHNFHDLPLVDLIETSTIPIDKPGFDLVVAWETSAEKARRIANSLHLPLVLVCYENPRLPCHYRLWLGIKPENLICSAVSFPVKPNFVRKTRTKILVRAERIDVLAPVMKVPLTPLSHNPNHRLEQYESTSCLINLHNDRYLPELEECLAYGIPCFTVPNKFHQNIPTFTSNIELDGLMKSYNQSIEEPGHKESFFDELHKVGHILKKEPYNVV